MDFEPDLEHGIYRVMHYLLTDRSRIACESDLLFVDGRPLLVLEWTPPDGRPPPTVTVELDLARLSEEPGRFGYFLYDGDVEDPRTRQ